MALVTHPGGTQISGKVGGIVYASNAGGDYIRNKGAPTNPNTDRQNAVRVAVRNLAIFWTTQLTQLLRDGWDAYGAAVAWTNRQGASIKLTGMNHFVRCNTTNVVLAIPRIDQAPAIQDIGDAEDQLAATASEATQDLTIDGNAAGPWILEALGWQHWYMGLPQNASRKYFNGPWRYCHSAPGAGPPPFPAVAAAPWPIQEGQRIWLRSRIQRGDGRLSEFAQINFLTAP